MDFLKKKLFWGKEFNNFLKKVKPILKINFLEKKYFRGRVFKQQQKIKPPPKMNFLKKKLL